MKKLLIVSTLLLLICGCNKKEEKVKTKKVKQPKVEVKENNKEEKYQDDNNTPIGLYLQDGYTLNLVKDYKTNIQNVKDIAVFQIYPSQDNQISLNKDWGSSFFEKWSSIPNYQNLKIGFNIKYTLDNIETGEQVNQTILDPSTTIKPGYAFLATYLYDDYLHRNDNNYSHIDENEYSEQSLFTSIKVFCANADRIVSKIKLTVFTYDNPEDIDENLEYRGNSSYTIEICDAGKTCD